MSYSTIRGEEKILNMVLWKGIRRVARSRFLKAGSSERLFDACWRQYRLYIRGSIDDPKSIADVMNWLEAIASEKVNDSKSSFYIYG
jgi:hypothetical protein